LEDEAGIVNTFFASFANRGKIFSWSFHHLRMLTSFGGRLKDWQFPSSIHL
jgi:hypothetical protein